MHRAPLVLLASLCVLCPRPALAQDDAITRFQDWLSKLGKPKPPPEEELGPRNTFTLNPLALRNKQLGVEYERAFGRRLSLYAAPEFAYGRTPGSWTLAVAGTVGTRIFAIGSAPSGIYFGPEVSVNYELRSVSRVRREGYGLGLGGSVGWTLVFLNRFTLAAGFSAQYRSIPDLDASEEGAVRVELVPTPRLAFGVAF